jgi:hypothetical protein
MFALFRALADRLRALFATDAALDFEAELLARDAERKAALLRQADRYQAEGLAGIAEHLRRQAEALAVQRPLASVLPSVTHLQEPVPGIADAPALPAPGNGALPVLDAPTSRPALPGPKRQGRKQ